MAALAALAGALGAWAAVSLNKWRKAHRLPPAGKDDARARGPAARAVVAEARADAPLALPPPPLPLSTPASLTLTTLDLSRSGLKSLDNLGSIAPKLVKLNVQGNPDLMALPDSIGALKRLTLLGAARCGLTRLPDTIGGCTALRELYLTGNDLVALPLSLAACRKLQKVQASFNPRLADLGGLAGPPAVARPPPNLEMLRVACCGLQVFPPGLAAAPKLCWVSFAGNPGCSRFRLRPARGGRAIASGDVRPGAPLGAGASGDVCVATLARSVPGLPPGPAFALKKFRADVGPDGAAADEVAVSRAVDHPALSRVLAVVRPDKKVQDAGPPGLLLELVPGSPLADRPTGDPLLRPHWPKSSEDALTIAPACALRVAAAMAGGLAHCHARGLAHGDFYAHNVLLRKGGEVEGGGGAPAVLVDWGAAFAYRDVERDDDDRGPPSPSPTTIPAWAFEAFETRAYGLFLGQLADWAGLVGAAARAPFSRNKDRVAAGTAARALRRAEKACLAADPAARPPLASLERELRAVADQVESLTAGGGA